MTGTVVVRVKPGSRKGPLVEVESDGALTVYVREPAVEGKATEAVVKLLAKHLGVARSPIGTRFRSDLAGEALPHRAVDASVRYATPR